MVGHSDEALVLSSRFGGVLLVHLVAVLIHGFLFDRCRTLGVDSDRAAITHDLFCIQTIFSTLSIFHIVGSLDETSLRSIRLQRLTTLRSQIIPFSFSNGISLRVQMHQVGLNFLLSLLQIILAVKGIEIHSVTIILNIIDSERTALLLSVNNTFHTSIVARLKQLPLLVVHETTRILSSGLRFSVGECRINLRKIRPNNIVVGGLIVGKNPCRRDIGRCGRSFLDPRSLLLSRRLRKLWLRARLIIVVQWTSVIAITPGVLCVALHVVLQRFI